MFLHVFSLSVDVKKTETKMVEHNWSQARILHISRNITMFLLLFCCKQGLGQHAVEFLVNYKTGVMIQKHAGVLCGIRKLFLAA